MITFKKLLAEAERLDSLASELQQGGPADFRPLTEENLEEEEKYFQTQYHTWLGDCLGILPEDLKSKFLKAYEGNSHVCMKRFIEAPFESIQNVATLTGGRRGERGIHSQWAYPYETVFHRHFLTQRQILIEADRRPLKVNNGLEAIAIIEHLAKNFHKAAHQIRLRHDKRATIIIVDEYDVQDLFHAMLMPFFEDIRPEEGTPSHAGKNSRIDFLLKREQIVIELKKTREGLTGKKIGEELTLDKNYYRNHPDCKSFIAFVYDPEKHIHNPKGLEDDLSQPIDTMAVKVIINQG